MAGKIEKLFFSNKSAGTICLWLVLFTCFYYPIGVGLIYQLKVPSTPVNILIRSLSAFTALYLILLWSFNERKELIFSKPVWFILLFWVFYGARIIIDLNRGVTYGAYSSFVVIGIAFGSILLPMIATILWGKYIDISKIPKIAIIIFAIANIIILSILVSENHGFNVGLFIYRPHIRSTSIDQDANILNPIQIGFYGEMLLITSMYFLLILKKSRLIFYLPLFLLGLVVLILGASRGPFLHCTITVLILLGYKYKIAKSKFLISVKTILILALMTGVFSQTIGKNITFEDISMVNRLTKFVDDRQNNKEEYRDIQFRRAWEDFLDSPIIGKQFVGTFDGFNPHNILLEVFMATGLIGATLFAGFFLPTLYRMGRVLLRKQTLYLYPIIIFLPILGGSLLSGSLFETERFWLIMVLILCSKEEVVI